MTKGVDASEYEPDTQSGVSYSRPKDLQAAGPDHPLYQRVTERGIDQEEGIDPEQGHSIPWNVPPTVLRHMSDSLYQSVGATIREFVANAETACLRVSEQGEAEIVEDDYQPIIEVTWRKDQNRLVIRDNGIGIASVTGVDVLRKIGVTTQRDTDNYSGQFGMGLASFLKLIGMDSSMILETHSRITGENYAAYVNLGGFDPIQGGLPENEYGTRFTMIHRNDIDADLREAVETYSEHLRIKVHYEEYNSEGKHVFDEDWGDKSLADEYSDDQPYVEVREPGLFTVTSSADATGKTLLNSIQIERNDEGSYNTQKYGAPFQFDIRLESEAGAVAAVPDADGELATDHEAVGKTPVSDAEYNIMDAQQQQKAVRESELPSGTITLPEPVSSRDTLQANEEFWEYIGDRVKAEFYAACREQYQQFGGLDDILKAQGRDLSRALEGVNHVSYGNGKSLQQAIEEEYGVRLAGDVCAMLKELNDDIKVGRPGDDTENLGATDEEPIYRVVAEVETAGGDVYMAATPNQQKARVAFDMGRDDPDDESDNLFVEIDTGRDQPVTAVYDKYEELFGWKQLKEISLHKLYEYDISAELYNDLTEEMGIEDAAEQGDEEAKEVIERAPATPPAQQDLNVSVSKKRSEQQWWKVAAIEEAFQDDETLSVSTNSWSGDSYHSIERLILFPSNSERNISDFYWLGGQYGAGSQVALANCNVGAYQYLDGLEGVYHVDSFAEAAWRLPVETHDGTTSITQARDDLVFHVVTPEAKPHFKAVAGDIVEVLPEFYEQGVYGKSWDGPSSVDMQYAPVTLDDVFEYVPAIRESDVTVIWADENPHFLGSGSTQYHKYDLWLYAVARLDRWALSSTVMQSLLSRHMGRNEDLTDGGYELVETMAHRHDAGKPPVDTP